MRFVRVRATSRHPGDVYGTFPAVVPPDGCETTESHERKFTALAEFCENYARELAAPPKQTRGKQRGRGRPKARKVDPNAIVKLMDAAIKARRAASSLARVREDDAEA